MKPIETVVKSRKAEMSSRGIYIQDRELLNTVFLMGTHFDYDVRPELNLVIVVPSKTNLKNTVSKRQMKGYVKPVIDIRKKEVLKAFDGCVELEIDIYESAIYIYGVTPEVQESEVVEEVVEVTPAINPELLESITWLYDQSNSDLILLLDVEAIIEKYCPVSNLEVNVNKLGEDKAQALYTEMKEVIGNAI
jgi:hypothetical protein